MIGGQSVDRPLSSIETFGFEDDNNCTIPNLPETRYGLAAFKTSSGALSVCGGWWEGKPDSTDCLTLDTSNGQWTRGSFEGNLFGEGVWGTATFEDYGVFIFHPWSISHLGIGSVTWVLGPETPVEVECACKVSETSFVVVGSNSGNNVLEYSITSGHWEEADTWPAMITKRKGPACAATSHHLVVAGGLTLQGEALASVEIYRLDSKNLGRASNMTSVRSFFTLIPVGLIRPRVLAIGGRIGDSFLDSSEFWEEDENEWEEGPQLGLGRSSMGTIMIESKFACVDNLLPHSCQATESDKECVFHENLGTYCFSEKTICFLLFLHPSIARNNH